ncbi:hypothetical protein TorRG33x02_256910 [Trema orientale]|uniref:Uncharacterized protein n=1 Tax=Trema orientale TaxID=63057 RepID=A0A2P5DAK5_TREOI|nr:hypothetical protein TorRG33x02_256910 [Trema orientale]
MVHNATWHDLIAGPSKSLRLPSTTPSHALSPAPVSLSRLSLTQLEIQNAFPISFPTLHPPPQPSASDPNHPLRHPNLSLGPNLSFVPQFVENFALFRSLYLSLSLSLSLSETPFFLAPDSNPKAFAIRECRKGSATSFNGRLATSLFVAACRVGIAGVWFRSCSFFVVDARFSRNLRV